jgi:hypothetical protein
MNNKHPSHDHKPAHDAPAKAPEEKILSGEEMIAARTAAEQDAGKKGLESYAAERKRLEALLEKNEPLQAEIKEKKLKEAFEEPPRKGERHRDAGDENEDV